jgi:bifunctional UDP-N-acetylglucosamine pyrophosphorylase / glucosamine-1-phosphate N-acetyltransferase
LKRFGVVSSCHNIINEAQHMSRPPLLSVVLGAGKGTRMKSDLPKVLHAVAGLPMLGHVLKTAQAAGTHNLSVVIGPGMDNVRAVTTKLAPGASVYIQELQRGTADAVLAARPAIAGHKGDVIVLYADTPLIRPETITRLRDSLDAGAHVAVLGFHADDPTNYGRLLVDGSGALIAIREHADASAEERKITLCNSGVLAFRCPDLAGLLSRIEANNPKGEYYLTDAIELARKDGLSAAVVLCPENEVLGVNSRDQLAAAERIFQTRARHSAMTEGATLIAPETVWFAHDTKIGRDVIIEPNVFFGPGVTVGEGAEIEGAIIGKGARIGPFARLRPGADLSADVHIGNFVEVKNVKMGVGSKANHLAYLGDGTVGTKANIGAGTIFCNYDGFNKAKTEIGDGAFVGSNSSLVAPVKIGAGAYIGSGSVITREVDANALAVERADTRTIPGWGAKFRDKMTKLKAAKATSS